MGRVSSEADDLKALQSAALLGGAEHYWKLASRVIRERMDREEDKAMRARARRRWNAIAAHISRGLSMDRGGTWK